MCSLDIDNGVGEEVEEEEVVEVEVEEAPKMPPGQAAVGLSVSL